MAAAKEDIKKVLFSEEQIRQRVQELGKQISEDYAGKKVVMIALLKGAAWFATDLSEAIDFPIRLDFMVASSYGSGTESSGTLIIRLDIREDIAGKHVLLVDDIIDSGNTFTCVKRLLEKNHPASIKTVAMCDKRERRAVDIQADYVGFQIPDEFVVGYGLDYAGDYRNLPFIGVLKSSVYGRPVED